MTTGPPTWNLTAWFPKLDSDAYRLAIQELTDALTTYEGQMAHAVPLTVDSCSRWADHIQQLESMGDRWRHLRAFVSCLTSANADDQRARRESVQVAALGARIENAESHVEKALGTASDESFLALMDDPSLSGLTYALNRFRARAARRLEPALETLASQLSISGLHAWGTLYKDITGQLEFPVAGEPKPLAWRRSLMQDPDTNIRHEAFLRSNEALRTHGETLATALNAIADSRIRLQQARGSSVREEAIWAEGMSEETLEVMLDAVRSRRHLAQRYLALKAAHLGTPKIHFADIGAPISLGQADTFSWSEAKTMVLQAFEAYHPELALFAEEMFRKNYIEAEPRRGKRTGAFCTSSKRHKSSRVFMTFRGALGDVVTLAHELGHAYHNAVMADIRGLASRYPASLAETASILCESLVGDFILADENIDDNIRLQFLDKRLHSATVYMLNIPMRYEFECAFYDARTAGALGVNDLCALMDKTQKQVYGEVLDPKGTDPLFWASKLHFFLTGISFYNFPYTFGYLFSSGVLAEARRVGPVEFQPRLRALLRQTASGSVEDVARQALGVDLKKPDFWLNAMDKVQGDLNAFEAMMKRSG